MVLTLMLLLASAVAQAAEPNVLAPYRFNPAPQNLSPIEQQRAQSYRSQLQGQLNSLERQRSQDRLSPHDQQLLMDTRGELDRMDRVLEPRPRDR